MQMSFFTSCFLFILLFGLVFGWFGFVVFFFKPAIFFKHERKLSLVLVSFCQIFLYLLILQLLPLVQRRINGSGTLF